MLDHEPHRIRGEDIAKGGNTPRGTLPNDCVLALQSSENIWEQGIHVGQKLRMQVRRDALNHRELVDDRLTVLIVIGYRRECI